MSSLEANRLKKYRSLEAKIGNTRLVELQNIALANGNRLFAKLEYESHGGSHYDRVYVLLLRDLEEKGIIVPGETHLVETTTGNAGASFAWIASELGFESTVIIPADVSESRKRQIQDHGAKLVLSPSGQYIAGLIGTLRHYLSERKSEYESGRLCCPNHSRDDVSVRAVASMADEIVVSLKENSLKLGCLILGCGNGTTIRGLGRRIKEISPATRCVAFDPIEAPVAYERKFPGRYQHQFGVPPGTKPHRILGTGGWGVAFPHVAHPEFVDLIDDVELVRDEDMVLAQRDLATSERKFPGRSSAAAVAVARKLAANEKNIVFVVLFYDELNYYPLNLNESTT